MNPWLQFLGRLHPLLLHLPIGAFLLLAATELWMKRPGARGLERGTRTFLCLLTAAGALASAASGWWLGQEFESGGDTFWWHRGLGIGFAVCVTLTALAAGLGRGRLYGWLLAIGLVLLFPLGHYGAEMTHGAGFVTEPFRAAAGPRSIETPDIVEPTPTTASAYERSIAPILEANCLRCHGEAKQKSGLALHDPEHLMTPGESGLPPIVPGDPAASELLRRMRLDLEDDEHMPPSSKPQPSADEIALFESWIASGASFEGSVPAGFEIELTVDPVPVPVPLRMDDPAPRSAPPADAVAALRAEHVHVELLDPVEQLLWIDFGARADTDDAFARERLAPLADFVVELTLARTAVGDGVLELVREMPWLERLDLSGTACTSAGVALLGDHPALRALNLTGTGVDDAALASLATLPALERVYLWNTAVTAGGVESLAEQVPSLVIEATDPVAAEVLEVEAPVLLRAALDPDPVNELCPVTGRSVDPAIRIVHDRRVIGFCCSACPEEFWSAPEEYPVTR